MVHERLRGGQETESLSLVELENLGQAVDRQRRANLGVKKGALDVVCVDARKLSDDDYAVFAWGNGSEKLQPGFGSPGCKAAIRWLKAQKSPIGDTIAGLLEDGGASEMKLVLRLVKRSRGRPTNDTRRAVEDLKLGMNAETRIARQEALAQTQGGRKPQRDAETQATADETGKGLSTVYDARATLRRAKALRHNSPN